MTEALGWAHGRGLSVDDDLSYLREFEHVTLARVLIARHKSDRAERSIHEAVGLLERLLKAAEEGGRTGSVIEIRVLQGLAHEAQGDISAALMPLQQALTLAEPQGYVRVFVDEGAPMAELLTRMNASRESGTLRVKEYIHKLLAAFGDTNGFHPSHLHFAQAQVSFIPQPLVEPLSQRELKVLQLIAQGLSNREIGERLFLALSTVKGYNQKIFDKLQVQSRTEAIVRARELGLL